jgi:hypothetical protein
MPSDSRVTAGVCTYTGTSRAALHTRNYGQPTLDRRLERTEKTWSLHVGASKIGIDAIPNGRSRGLRLALLSSVRLSAAVSVALRRS